MKKPKKQQKTRQPFSMELMWKQRYLLAMSVPFLIWLFIFKYVPLWGWTMAFQEVVPKSFAKPIWERKFIGFDNFIQAFTDRLFAQRKTARCSLLMPDTAVQTAVRLPPGAYWKRTLICPFP